MAVLLVIEDDTELLRMIRLVLEKHGHQVYTAENGVEALYQVNAFRPTLIILDLMMPLASGEAVLEHLRSTPDLRGTRVLVVSALPTAHLTAEQLGADDVLQKPVEVATLVARVEELLRQAEPE
ncbi:MAG: response regulator transcription factor [Chloroflexota bacterium]|jgi:DNA-binding response OmpR family regulator